MADRTLRLIESNVMGQLAVVNLSAFVALAAIGQVLDVPASKVIGTAGGRPLDLVWSASLLAAFVVNVVAWIVRKQTLDAVIMELGGITILVAGLVTYAWALLSTDPGGIAGRGMILAMVSASCVNCCGRGLLLARQMWWVRKVRA